MEQRNLIPELGEVQRTPTSNGDRLMLALAVVALAGGLLIAVGKLAPSPDAPIAEASVGPSSTATPSRTQRPTPTERPLEQILVTPADPPTSVEQNWWGGTTWIRAREEIVVRAQPQPDSFSLGVMPAGAVAQAQTTDGTSSAEGWLYVNDPQPSGWVQVNNGEATFVDTYQQDENGRRSYVNVVAGESGFIAQRGDGSLATSTDGVTWREATATLAAGYPFFSVAEGPAGWLADSMLQLSRSGPEAPFLWRSADGVTWTPLGQMQTAKDGFWVNGIWGSPQGYLLWGSGNNGEDGFWFSANGLSWSELPPTGLPQGGWYQVTSTPFGFYVMNGDPGSRGTAVGAFTTDGATWQLVEDGPRDQAGWLTAIADQLIAVDRAADTDALQLWSGRVQGDGFAWRRLDDAAATFAGKVPALLTGNGRRAVLITWDRDTERVQSWSSIDGSTWAELADPADGFGVIPHQAAGSAAGVLVAGGVRVAGLPTVQLWRLAGNGWRAVAGNGVLGLDPADVGPCPDPPSEMVDFLILDGSRGAYCFGDAPISFRAYSVRCDGCGGSDNSATPTWLASSDPPLYLLPYEGENPNWLNLALDPSLERSDAWQGTWVDLVGHFDDPAAPDCRMAVDHDTEVWYAGRQQLVEDCRSRFVITEVTVVDGP